MSISFNSTSTPMLRINHSTIPKCSHKDCVTVGYDGRDFSVLVAGKSKGIIKTSNLSHELQGVLLERMTRCAEGVFLRLSKKDDEYVLELLHKPSVVKAVPVMLGTGMSAPLIGAIAGVCIIGGPPGWGFGAVIGLGVGLLTATGIMGTAILIDTADLNPDPKFVE